MYDWGVIENPVKPYAHQVRMTKTVVENARYALTAEMGTGKTKAMIDAYRLRSQYEDLIVLVVCPKSVIYSWEKDLAENNVTDYTVISANYSPAKRIKLFNEVVNRGHGIMITNYQQILAIKDVPYDSVHWWILDESHNIKNHQSKTAKKIINVSRNSKYRNIMTGTMIGNHPTDVWSQANFLNPELFWNINFYSFRARYCTMGGYLNKQIVAYRNQDELKRIIDTFCLQIKKEDCLDLPKKVYIPRILEMTPELKAQYNQMVKELILELSDNVVTATIAVTKIIRLAQITSGVYLKGTNEKLEALKELINDLVVEEGKSIVITYHFKESGNLIESAINEMKIPYSKIDGAVDDRGDQIANFQKKKTKIFLGQDQSIKEGVTLTASNYMITYENGYSMIVRKQIEDRIHRVGQTETCFYIDLCYKGSIDIEVHEAIRKKQDVATFLVDSFKKGGANFKS